MLENLRRIDCDMLSRINALHILAEVRGNPLGLKAQNFVITYGFIVTVSFATIVLRFVNDILQHIFIIIQVWSTVLTYIVVLFQFQFSK